MVAIENFSPKEMIALHIRHTKLLNIVNEKKRVAVTQLAQALDNYQIGRASCRERV